jgi:hypothetical protein
VIKPYTLVQVTGDLTLGCKIFRQPIGTGARFEPVPIPNLCTAAAGRIDDHQTSILFAPSRPAIECRAEFNPDHKSQKTPTGPAQQRFLIIMVALFCPVTES